MFYFQTVVIVFARSSAASCKIHLYVQSKMLMGDVMKMAGITLAETKFTMGPDIHNLVQHNIDKSRVKVRNRKENVAGDEFIFPVDLIDAFCVIHYQQFS